MSQVSKYLIDKNVYGQMFNVFLDMISGLKTKTKVSSFFDEFLSPTEKIMFVKRLAIGIFVAKDYDYRQISDLLKVSTATISTYKIAYNNEKEYKRVIDQILLDQKIERFLLSLSETISSVGAIGGAKSSGWLNLRNEIRKKRLNKVL